jgi:hypothetical protein
MHEVSLLKAQLVNATGWYQYMADSSLSCKIEWACMYTNYVQYIITKKTCKENENAMSATVASTLLCMTEL